MTKEKRWPKTFSNQLTNELYDWIKARSIKNNRSLAGEVRYLLEWIMRKIIKGEIEL